MPLEMLADHKWAPDRNLSIVALFYQSEQEKKRKTPKHRQGIGNYDVLSIHYPNLASQIRLTMPLEKNPMPLSDLMGVLEYSASSGKEHIVYH